MPPGNTLFPVLIDLLGSSCNIDVSFYQARDSRGERTGLLGEEKTVALFQGDTVTAEIVSSLHLSHATQLHIPRVLVIGGETGGVGRLGNLTTEDL
jgi:hypothetical protein